MFDDAIRQLIEANVPSSVILGLATHPRPVSNTCYRDVMYDVPQKVTYQHYPSESEIRAALYTSRSEDRPIEERPKAFAYHSPSLRRPNVLGYHHHNASNTSIRSHRSLQSNFSTVSSKLLENDEPNFNVSPARRPTNKPRTPYAQSTGSSISELIEMKKSLDYVIQDPRNYDRKLPSLSLPPSTQNSGPNIKSSYRRFKSMFVDSSSGKANVLQQPVSRLSKHGDNIRLTEHNKSNFLSLITPKEVKDTSSCQLIENYSLRLSRKCISTLRSRGTDLSKLSRDELLVEREFGLSLIQKYRDRILEKTGAQPTRNDMNLVTDVTSYIAQVDLYLAKVVDPTRKMSTTELFTKLSSLRRQKDELAASLREHNLQFQTKHGRGIVRKQELSTCEPIYLQYKQIRKDVNDIVAVLQSRGTNPNLIL